MKIIITIELPARKPLFSKFTYWKFWGFEIGGFDFTIRKKRYRRVVGWQETVLDYLRANENYRINNEIITNAITNAEIPDFVTTGEIPDHD